MLFFQWIIDKDYIVHSKSTCICVQRLTLMSLSGYFTIMAFHPIWWELLSCTSLRYACKCCHISYVSTAKMMSVKSRWHYKIYDIIYIYIHVDQTQRVDIFIGGILSLRNELHINGQFIPSTMQMVMFCFVFVFVMILPFVPSDLMWSPQTYV